MESSELKDSNARAFIVRVTLEVLADAESRGAIVSRELLLHCLIEALKGWLDTEAAKNMILPCVDKAYDTWHGASQEHAN